MSSRVTGDYFNIFTAKDPSEKQPTQTGSLQVSVAMLEAITDIARSQQMSGDPIDVGIDLGFWVQVGKESGAKYLRGRPTVFVSDGVEEKMRELNEYAEGAAPPVDPSSQAAMDGYDENEIPF
jgi:hypothetical protein